MAILLGFLRSRWHQQARCLLNSVIAKAPSREALLTAIRDSKTFTEPARNLALQQAPPPGPPANGDQSLSEPICQRALQFAREWK